MKLIIQIPCHNEAETLAETVAELPRDLEGFDEIECLVVDDGSTDSTVKVARELGVHHIVVLPAHQGLARAFETGLTACLDNNADVIVNTDADNQYCASGIPSLVAPILKGEADMVVGARPIEQLKHFSTSKKLLQKLGSWAVRRFSNTDIPDATSGFRALSREAAQRLNVFSTYSYTLETIIQAGRSNITVASIPVQTNTPRRESRLIKSVPSYLWQSMLTMVRVFILYKPLRFFVLIGSVFFGAGVLLGMRFTYYYLIGQGEGKIQSLILAAVLLLMGFQLGVVGLLSDLIATNRRILEELQAGQRRLEDQRADEH
jgi:glycosyltransferase involved in cell wall biosynthesis